MEQSNEVDKLIHEARLLSIRGQYAESVSKYQTAVNMYIDTMSGAPDEEKTRMQETLHMYLEEADAVKSVMNGTPVERQRFQSSPSSSSKNPVQTVQGDSSKVETTFVEDLSKLFSDIGRGAFDERYKVSESCEKVTNEVVNKTVEFMNRSEIEGTAQRVGDSIQEWNETYHISDRISTAINNAADATTRLVDQLFPFMQNQPINSQYKKEENEKHPPEDSIIVSVDEESSSPAPAQQEFSDIVSEGSAVAQSEESHVSEHIQEVIQPVEQPQLPVEGVHLQEKQRDFKNDFKSFECFVCLHKIYLG